ncbi:putative ribonuclease H-like domain-containing protein [Tanacetum coccineum]
MRTRRFFQKIGRKITINGSDITGYDKSKVECFNCHKLGHFSRECRGPRNQDSRNWNQDSSRRTVNVEETSSKAMLAIDGAGFDWSYMADDEVPTNMPLMAFSDSENRVLIVRPHNKTPYELFRGKFNGKSDEGFFVGYSLNSKAFRVHNIRTRKVEENLHIRFLEDKPIIVGDRPKWLFDIDVLTKSMNYVPVVAGTNSNDFVGTKESVDTGRSSKETGSSQDYILMPLCKDGSLFDSSSKNRPENSTQDVNTDGSSINTASINFNTSSLNINTVSLTITKTPLEATHADFFDDESELDMSNITTTYLVLSTLNTIIHKDHSLDHVIGDVQSGVQTRRMTKTMNEQGFISVVYKGKTHEDLHTCLFACFLSQEEPKKVIQALKDPSWIEAMQEELLQFKLQQVWTLVDLPYGKRAIETKWMYRNKKDERGIVIRNKARLVAQGCTQEEGIDYDEVFTLGARIEVIRLFLAYASFEDFVVYQMDMKSAFLYGKIEEEVYVCQPLGFKDPDFPDRVYNVEKALYGLHQAPRAWIASDKKNNGIFISQDKYVEEILKKFGFSTMKTASTPMETSKPLFKDAEAKDVDVHLYRSMIGSLMYLTASRPKIMFVVCACARFQVTPKGSHLHAVKKIFRYLKGQPKLGLWYLKDSPFDLEAYTDSDYAGASIDKKSTTRAEYVAAASCCGQVLWIQNQMLDYGYNFMNTKIFIDNESTICIVKNLVFHSKTKHIEIRHHFIRDSNEKNLIQMIKIHTDLNVADLLTKSFNFWQTAIASTLDNREMEITATIDGKVKIVSEASIRRHLKLEDSNGISNLPTTKIFEQLSLMGYVSNSDKLTFQKETEVPQPSSPPYTNVADKAASTGVDVRYGGAATTITGLEA